MIQDGPMEAYHTDVVKNNTSIISDTVAEPLVGICAQMGVIATNLWLKMEKVLDRYFGRQHIVPGQLDFENEALRFALWMYRERDRVNAPKDRSEAEE